MSFEKKSENIRFPKIAEEIKKMVDVDQAMRKRTDTEHDYWDDDVDIRNTKRMKEVISEIGWPTISKVGKVASGEAWLLVQHADLDVDFQTLCLAFMKAEPQEEVSRHDIAFLENRIRINQNKGQLYGTQFRQKNNEHIPCPIEDEENVNARRAEMGMGPLAEQIQHMYEKYPFEDEE